MARLMHTLIQVCVGRVIQPTNRGITMAVKKIRKHRNSDSVQAVDRFFFKNIMGVTVYADVKPNHKARALSALPVGRIMTGPNATPYVPKYIPETRFTEEGDQVRTGGRILNPMYRTD